MDDLGERGPAGPGNDLEPPHRIDDCDFGRHLAWFRMREALRQVDLAERSGMSVRTISDLERGVSAAPRLSTLRALERALGLADADRDRLREVAACARFRARLRDFPDRPGPGGC